MTSTLPRVVLDASVVLRWFLPDEDFRGEAASLRRSILDRKVLVFAPVLWHIEVINGLLRGTRRKRLGPGLAAEALQSLAAISPSPVASAPSTILAMAEALGVSAYDAAYVAAAAERRAQLWTGDIRLVSACAAAPVPVRWIGDYDGKIDLES